MSELLRESVPVSRCATLVPTAPDRDTAGDDAGSAGSWRGAGLIGPGCRIDAFVVGVGHRDRGDDAVGPAVLDELGRILATGDTASGTAPAGKRADLAVVEGDLLDLALRWRADQAVVIVDACRTGVAPGSVIVLDGLIDAGRLVASRAASTHGLGLAEAIQLARHLGMLPRRLTIVGVEVGSVEPGAMSPAVSEAVPVAVSCVLRELGRPDASRR